MSEVNYYVALPFVFSDDGMAAGEAAECLSANAAVMRAEALSRKPGHAGAMAFSRSGDSSSGDFSDAKQATSRRSTSPPPHIPQRHLSKKLVRRRRSRQSCRRQRIAYRGLQGHRPRMEDGWTTRLGARGRILSEAT
jgi:hypothetical protein